MTLQYTVRPISDRTAFTGRHESSPFTASWSDTLDVLEREIAALNGKHVVIEVDVAERGIRNDGQLRADAKAATPAVRVAFDSKHGPLVYATDRYERPSWDRSRMDSWQHNVRAIALGLEALRKVDRYGISRRGEQYRGYKAIGGGTGAVATAMTTDEARAVLYENAPPSKRDQLGLRDLARWAKAGAHPDCWGGDRTRWDRVDQATQVLERAGAL